MPYRTLSLEHNGALRTHLLTNTPNEQSGALRTHYFGALRTSSCLVRTIDAPSTPNWRTSSVTHPDRYPGDPRRRTVQQRGHDRTQRHEEVGLDNFSQNTLFDQFDLTLNMPFLILDMFVLIFDMFW